MEEVQELGIEQLDFIYVSGDAYVDHPSFGPAIITRVLHAHGYHVGIIAQPDWKNDDSITVLGTPRLGFLVSSGNMDSMVNHYYVSKKHRKQMLIHQAAYHIKDPIMLQLCTAISYAENTEQYRLLLVVLKQASDAWRIMITGQTHLNVLFCLTAKRI